MAIVDIKKFSCDSVLALNRRTRIIIVEKTTAMAARKPYKVREEDIV
jgi:hypothetical protein